MKTQIIQEIEQKVTQAQETLKEFVVSAHREERYGKEQEYTPKSFKDGIKEILMDIRNLVETHERFITVSTHNERKNISSDLSNLTINIENESYTKAASHLDNLKITIRGYNVGTSSETQKILEERIDQLNQQCSTLEKNLVEIEKIGKKSRQAHEKIQSAEEKIETIYNTIAALQNKTSKTENLYVQSQQNHKDIKDLLTSAKSSEGVIKSFFQQIEKRQQQLEQQQALTASYKENLQEYTEERKTTIEEAKKLIEKARNALGYKTAEGISAAFNERYLEEKARGIKNLLWLVGATSFVCIGIWIGFSFVENTQQIGLGLVVSRITIIPLAFYAAWFCAAQYVNHRNTLEDYSYKSVLSKSFMAFLEQLEGEERKRYLEMVLSEIHQDPLRKKHDVDTPASKLFKMFERKEKSRSSDNSAKDPTDNE